MDRGQRRPMVAGPEGREPQRVARPDRLEEGATAELELQARAALPLEAVECRQWWGVQYRRIGNVQELGRRRQCGRRRERWMQLRDQPGEERRRL